MQQMSCQLLLEIDAWFQRTTVMKWPMGNRMTSRYPKKAYTLKASKTAGDAI